MVFVGKISYSLYLWHWPIIVFAVYANVEELDAWQGIGCLALSFAFAWGSYLWIEQPVRRNGHGKRPLLFGAAAAAMAAAVGIGGVFVLSDGIPGRLSPVSVALLDRDQTGPMASCHRVTPARAAAGVGDDQPVPGEFRFGEAVSVEGKSLECFGGGFQGCCDRCLFSGCALSRSGHGAAADCFPWERVGGPMASRIS
ncbi:acyltransferase family protein [Mangrovicoccus ximenensis]|uniref:acyltransferase family protein n=1 Tax=Mangrovicoccus ximenensis TaxID=1911570 RepID=UPI001F1D9F36|nr:acyltransferase [Mangrovicoccus ximenensis]